MSVLRCNITDEDCILKMVNVIKGGGVVVYPTDTVYGLGGDPFDINVVNRITHLKGRRINPYPVLVGDKLYAFKLYEEPGGIVVGLTDSFWPGALTIINKSRTGIPASFFQRKIGLRMPGNKKLLEVINLVGGFLIGTSANISSYPPASNVSMAVDYFEDDVDLYVDGGELGYKSSTVVEVIDRKVIIKRIGVIPRNVLESFCDLNRCIVI